jgi:predicted CopG family antitoxin
VTLTKAQIEGCKWSTLPLSPIPSNSSTSSLRARQAQYPVSSESGFLTTTSTETKSMVANVVYVTLGKMKAEMESLEAVIAEEVKRRVDLENLPLKKLYFLPRKSEPARRVDREGWQQGSESPSDSSPGPSTPPLENEELNPRKLARALYEGLVEGVDYF